MPTRLERLVAIKDEIDRGRYPDVQKLCDMFEIQPRTLHEDLRMMREMMGLEIKHDRSRNGYYNGNPSKKLPTFDLTVGEVFALTLAKQMLAEYSGTPFHPILQGALDKIQQRLPDKVRMEMSDVSAAVQFGRLPAPQFSRKMFMELHEACESHTRVKLQYFSAYRGEVTNRTVDPYKLLAHQNSWYLVAYCNLRLDLRLFALHRIQSFEITQEKFQPIDQQKMDNWLQSPLFIEHQEQEVPVSIKFEPRAARYIREKIWHPTQALKDHDDGSCTLSFNSPGLDEVRRWVLGFGADAQVLEPESLKSAVIDELRRALAGYGK